MSFNPTVDGRRPWFEAKLQAGAIASIAQLTGTPVTVTKATSTVTLAELAGIVMALAASLQTRGIIE